MKDIGINVNPVRPGDRGTLDFHRTEKCRIGLQRLEDRPPELVLQIEDAFRRVVETQSQDKATERLDIGDADHFGLLTHGNGSILARVRSARARVQFSLT